VRSVIAKRGSDYFRRRAAKARPTAAVDPAKNPTSFPVQLVSENEKPGAMAGAF
jgi:hypothetical protein